MIGRGFWALAQPWGVTSQKIFGLVFFFFLFLFSLYLFYTIGSLSKAL